tara:strand:+ start:403 stop:2256 length:1854 start_codon:yes stop_codon:yes gene_type:complete
MRFKYSFMAVIATMLAIILNLLFIFSIPTLFIISIILLICIFAARYVLENYNLVAIFCAFFIAGLISSALYNNYARVYEAPDYLHDEKTWVNGEITDIKIKNKYARVYLKNPELYTDLADGVYIPNIIVSTFSSRLKDAKVGDELTAKVLLQKPPGKLFNDDFNYAEYLLQNKINLTAQVRGDLYITYPVDGYSLLQKMANYRLDVANKIKSTYENSQVAGLTMALITGIRGGVEKQVQEDFKKSGLAHLMAISGMHMAFLAGIIFLLVRYVVCLIPVIALNYDSKKIAGVFTLFAALFYLLLAGASLPTQRAFIMISLFIITMLLNRSKVALHTLCIVAILILLADPMAIFSASFQLSFSAVFAMLLYNELKQQELILDFSQKAKLWRGFKNSLNISILAFSATMFVVSVHFGYLSVFAILANVFASILMAVLVMPALFAYFIGFIVLDISIFKDLSEYSLTLLLNLADYFAEFANSSVYISPNYAFVLLFVAVSIITLIVLDYSRKYLLSLAIFFASFFAPIHFDLRPSVIELNNGSVALRSGDELTLLGDLDKRSLNKLKEFYKLKLASNQLDKDCDTSGCVYNFANKKILHLNEGFDISNEDLTLVDYVVSYN